MTGAGGFDNPLNAALSAGKVAACSELAEEDKHIFFDTAAGPHRWQREAAAYSRHAAKTICASCEVRVECLEFAMTVEPLNIKRFGIWGGLTPLEREMLAKGGSV